MLMFGYLDVSCSTLPWWEKEKKHCKHIWLFQWDDKKSAHTEFKTTQISLDRIWFGLPLSILPDILFSVLLLLNSARSGLRFPEKQSMLRFILEDVILYWQLLQDIL